MQVEDEVQAAHPEIAWTLRRARVSGEEKVAYEHYLVLCSEYMKRQMMIYEHWPQRRYDVLGYRNEKVFTDMNA